MSLDVASDRWWQPLSQENLPRHMYLKHLQAILLQTCEISYDGFDKKRIRVGCWAWKNNDGFRLHQLIYDVLKKLEHFTHFWKVETFILIGHSHCMLDIVIIRRPIYITLQLLPKTVACNLLTTWVVLCKSSTTTRLKVDFQSSHEAPRSELRVHAWALSSNHNAELLILIRCKHSQRAASCEDWKSALSCRRWVVCLIYTVNTTQVASRFHATVLGLLRKSYVL
jgi:hypothetical protein